MKKRTPPPVSFAVLIARKEDLQERWRKACRDFDSEANARIDALPEHAREDAIKAEKERAREWRIPWDQESMLLDEQIEQAAERFPLPILPELSKVWEISENSFSTQTNSSGYSRGLAEWTAHQLRAQGIEAEVREHTEPPPFKELFGRRCVGLPYFQVWAKTTELGYKQFQHRPCLPLRDFVQFMWRRGLNPRVYNPHIPHGFEEKAGLNFYGEDVAPKVKK